MKAIVPQKLLPVQTPVPAFNLLQTQSSRFHTKIYMNSKIDTVLSQNIRDELQMSNTEQRNLQSIFLSSNFRKTQHLPKFSPSATLRSSNQSHMTTFIGGQQSSRPLYSVNRANQIVSQAKRSSTQQESSGLRMPSLRRSPGLSMGGQKKEFKKIVIASTLRRPRPTMSLA
mmetsp:Transcript_33995/g.52301  ORF Transcript_33995/g.52301 Transcript_33995/m.52301 type:complete len:171 (+) Transcript_33995:1595-2107(+)